MPISEIASHAKPLIIVPDDSIGKNITVVGYPARIPNVASSLQGEVMYVSSGSILGYTLKSFYQPTSFYTEVKALITKKYSNLLIGQEEQSVISSLHTIEQVAQFLDYPQRRAAPPQ